MISGVVVDMRLRNNARSVTWYRAVNKVWSKLPHYYYLRIAALANVTLPLPFQPRLADAPLYIAFGNRLQLSSRTHLHSVADGSMAEEDFSEKLQDLSDLELATLICLTNHEHCIIDTDPGLLDDLVLELRLVSLIT